jgi:hypothetical protein
VQLLAMEYVEGWSLAQVLEKKGQLPVVNACNYVRQAALGLQHAHERQMVHRDLKPQNLMLTPKGQVEILDFGLAKVVSEQVRAGGLTSENVVMGTPDYLVPEQGRDAHSADIRADIYSLGCTLYCLLTGDPPYPGGTAVQKLLAHLDAHRRPRPLAEVRPDLPAGLSEVVEKMMAKDPAARYQTPQEVAEALTPFARRTPSAESKTDLATGRGERRESVWEDVARSSSGATAGAAKSSVAARVKGRLGLWPAIAGSVVLLGLLAAGIVIKFATPDGGTLVVEVSEPGAEIIIDGKHWVVAWDAGRKRAESNVPAGSRKVEVTKDGFTTKGEEVAVADGGRQVLKIVLEPKPAKPAAPAPADEGFVALFDGQVHHRLEDTPLMEDLELSRGPWYVEGGLLTSRGGPNPGPGNVAFIMSRRNDYENFTLRVTIPEPNKWSGLVTVRGSKNGTSLSGYAGWTGGITEKHGYRTAGCLAKVLRTPNDDFGARALLAEEVPLPAGKPYLLEVTALGGVITSFVNGKQVAQLSDTKNPFLRGHIRLPCRSGIVVRYSKIEIKELP